jgi:hypothetical protein
MSDQNPSAHVPEQGPADPLGDRGHGDKTWTPEPGEQGISNRVNDEEPGSETDSTSFGQDSKDVVSMAEEEPADGEEFDDDEDDEKEDEEDLEDDGEDASDEDGAKS